MTPQVRVMVEQGTKKRRLPTRRRPGRSNVVHFETTAAPVAAAAQPSWLDRAPLLEIGQSENVTALSPGEKRVSRVYHTWSLGDVAVSFALAAVSGGLLGVSSIPICFAFKLNWYWVPITWLGATTIVWFVKVTDFFDNDKAVVSNQEQERVAEPAPIIQEPPAVEIVINEGKTQKRAKLKAPTTNHAGLWQYADALLRGTAAPSYGGSKNDGGLLGAKAYGYTPAEFDKGPGTWRPTAIAGGLLEEDPHKSKGYRLTRPGGRAMAYIVREHKGEWG